MSKPAILDRMQVLSDPMRCRLLAVLDRAELTVSDLCDVLQAPQSTVSRHLKVLGDDGWIVARREGTNRHYSMAADALPSDASDLWEVVQGHLSEGSNGDQDALRLESVLARRRSRSREFFDRSAGEWDELRTELFGETAELSALFALLDEEWVVGDLGCGTGRAAERLAPWVRRVVAVDGSESMLEEAAYRLQSAENVELRHGELERLPIEQGELDAALLVLVLHHVSDPQAALAEVARAVKPAGRLVILDMRPHDRAEYRGRMGHQWLGFGREELESWLQAAGFSGFRDHSLSPEPETRGPALFVATARRDALDSTGQASAN